MEGAALSAPTSPQAKFTDATAGVPPRVAGSSPTGGLTNLVPLRYSGDMLDTNDPEDRQIRVILISAAAAAILGLLTTVTVVAVMVSANFNFLSWME